MKYKINNFNYINTFRETNNLVKIKSNIKSKADEGIRSPVAWVIGKYAMHCDAMLVWSAEIIAL